MCKNVLLFSHIQRHFRQIPGPYPQIGEDFGARIRRASVLEADQVCQRIEAGRHVGDSALVHFQVFELLQAADFLRDAFDQSIVYQDEIPQVHQFADVMAHLLEALLRITEKHRS